MRRSAAFVGLGGGIVCRSNNRMHKRQKQLQEIAVQRDCSICQESLLNDDDECFLACDHQFHTVCLCGWLIENNSCPVCRRTVKACQHVETSENLAEFLSKHSKVSTIIEQLLEKLQKNKNEIQSLQDQLFLAEQPVIYYVYF